MSKKSIYGAKLLALFVPLSGVAWSRYQNLLFLDAGYSPTSIGILKTSGFAAKLLFGPLWGFVGDLKSPLWLLSFSYIVSMVSLEVVRQCIVRQYPFALMLILKTLRSSVNCIGPVTEAVLFNATKNRTDGENFGKQRMLSSIAWGCGAFFVGWMIDSLGMYSIFPYTYVMCSLVLLLIHCLSRYQENDDGSSINTSKITTTTTTTTTTTNTTSKRKKTVSNVCQGINRLLSHPEMKLCASQIVLTGFCMTLVDVLLPLQLETQFQTSRTINGITTWLSVLSSVPIYWYGKELVDKKGVFWMFRVAQATYGIRLMGMVLLSSFTSLETALHYLFLGLLQLMHGITFALVWIGATHKLQSFASFSSKDQEQKVTTSAATLVSLLYFTIGQGVGNVFWMYLYQQYNNCGALYFAGWCLLVLNHLLLPWVVVVPGESESESESERKKMMMSNIC